MNAKTVIGYVAENEGVKLVNNDMTNMFNKYYTKSTDKLITLSGQNHKTMTKAAFNYDANGDGNSDLIEWMLSQ